MSYCFIANSCKSDGNSCGMPPQEKPIKGVSDTAPTISGSLPDIFVASITTPKELMEYLYLTVFQDDKRTKQGNTPTDNAQPLLTSGPSLASRAVLDTESTAGDLFRVIKLDAITKYYASPSALNVCSGLNGICYIVTH